MLIIFCPRKSPFLPALGPPCHRATLLPFLTTLMKDSPDWPSCHLLESSEGSSILPWVGDSVLPFVHPSDTWTPQSPELSLQLLIRFYWWLGDNRIITENNLQFLLELVTAIIVQRPKLTSEALTVPAPCLVPAQSPHTSTSMLESEGPTGHWH